MNEGYLGVIVLPWSTKQWYWLLNTQNRNTVTSIPVGRAQLNSL
jgi:hypothetical protein